MAEPLFEEHVEWFSAEQQRCSARPIPPRLFARNRWGLKLLASLRQSHTRRSENIIDDRVKNGRVYYKFTSTE